MPIYFSDIVNELLLEADSKDSIVSELNAKASKDVKKTYITKDPRQLVDMFFVQQGGAWSSKPTWSGSVQKKNLDDVTAKYVDAGANTYNALATKPTVKVNTIDELAKLAANDKDALDIINKFLTTDIDQYQCTSPILRKLSDVDRISEIALEQFNNDTIYGAIYKMIQRRAGVLSAAVNTNNLNNILYTPEQYITGERQVPELFANTLSDSNLYVKELLQIALTAKAYFQYLLKQNNVTTSTNNDLISFIKDGKMINDAKVYNISTIKEDTAAPAQKLIEHMQNIAHFVKTKKSLLQRLGGVAGSILRGAEELGTALSRF